MIEARKYDGMYRYLPPVETARPANLHLLHAPILQLQTDCPTWTGHLHLRRHIGCRVGAASSGTARIAGSSMTCRPR